MCAPLTDIQAIQQDSNSKQYSIPYDESALLKDNPILMHLSVNLRNQAREVTDVATNRL